VSDSGLSGTIASKDAELPATLSRTSVAAIGLGIFVAAFVILWPTTVSLMERWNDTDGKTYTHGYLIVLISAWLMWRDRDRVQAAAASPFTPALLAVAATSCVWLLSLRSGIQTGHQVLLPVLIWLAVAGALGWRAAVATTFAVGYLYFAIPIWGAVNSVLQSLTTLVVGAMLHLTGVVATIDGNFIHLPVGTFEIAAGCSGIHFFIVALAISALYGEIHRDSLKVRAQLLVLATIIAAATNWIRVYVIVVAGYLTDMQHYLVRVEHYRFGWAVFAISMTIFILIARRLPTNDSSVAAQGVRTVDLRHSTIWLAVVASVGLMAVGPIWNLLTRSLEAALPSQDKFFPMVSTAGSNGPVTPIRFNWAPQFLGADASVHARYVTDGHDVEIYTAIYIAQHQGKELVAYDNSILGTERADVLKESNAGTWRELEVRSAVGPELIRYQYRIGAMRTSDDLRAQISYGLQSFVEAPLSRLIALRTDCAPDCAAARQRLNDLAEGLRDGEVSASNQGGRR
jgi:exosortase A